MNGHTRATFPNDTSLGILLHTSILSAFFALSLFVRSSETMTIELRSVTDFLENVQEAICVRHMISGYKTHTVTEYFQGPKMGVCDQ